MTAQGRDISSYDSGVNYGAYDFLIGKYTEGASYVSPGATARANATRAAGKVFGAYHFAQPGDGAQQADNFLSVGAPLKGDLPGFLDYEVDGLGIGFLNAFCQRYHARTGYWPGVYVDLSRYQGELQSGRGWRQAGQRLWIARYSASGPGVSCDIWQHQGDPDLDIAYTPLSEMTIGGSGPLPSSPWRAVDNVDNTVWVQGRAPVLALEKRPYPSSTQPTTADMRRVPADHCANDKTGITRDWANYIYDLFNAIPWDSTGTWANEFGIVAGDTYGRAHFNALSAWGARHGGVRPGGDSGDWANLWATLQGQVHVS
ncbi:glycoside hydrolase family 25 protein [Fodinicola feengrottensis]|uniref:Lysozyme n=1 Tax=Fodinicola feengrottensis TaxID=435914 RepID=A0ABN2IB82_9ACTN|nr:GH25 family lysozyme [Fodinicola feengrottensis]